MNCFFLFFVAAETPVKVAVNEVDKVDTDELEFCEEVTEVVNPIVPDPARKNSKEVCGLKRNNHKQHKVTQDQVLAEQYKALLLKQDNLKLESKSPSSHLMVSGYYSINLCLFSNHFS